MAFRIIPPAIVDNAVSMAASFSGTPISVQNFDRLTFEILAIGTPTGAVTIQTSNDFIPAGMTPLPSVSVPNWVDLPLSLTPLVGADQGYFVDFTSTGMAWLRVNYTRTGGAGALTSVITAKEF